MRLPLPIARVHGEAWKASLKSVPPIEPAVGDVAQVEGRGAGATLTAALTFSVFYIIVGIGQMFVVSTGPGNVDLSIPATIALAGVVGMKVMAGSDALILPGLAAALGVGLAVGIGNFALIRVLAIPPIIATLSSSLIIQSTAIATGRGTGGGALRRLCDRVELHRREGGGAMIRCCKFRIR